VCPSTCILAIRKNDGWMGDEGRRMMMMMMMMMKEE
jgi:hypothetical protein